MRQECLGRGIFKKGQGIFNWGRGIFKNPPAPLTICTKRCTVLCVHNKFNKANFLLFRAVEIQRICEAAATPAKREGANLSERSNNKRIVYGDIKQSAYAGCFFDHCDLGRERVRREER